MQAIKGIWTRIQILLFFCFDKKIRKRSSWKEVMSHLFAKKCEAIARDYSSLEKETEGYKSYKIKGFDNLFLYPAKAPFHNFAQVITEGMIMSHWHHYEIQHTQVDPGDVIVDCGSAEGFFAFKYQNVASKIFVVEPLPLFVDSLNKMFLNNSSVEVLPYALGSENGKLYMELNESAIASTCRSSPAGMENFVEVQAFKIDSLFAEKNIRVNYLKADLEGFEEEMIKGALETIRINKPKIAITTYHDGQDYKKLIKLITSVAPDYKFLVKGIEHRAGNPVMLHMWT